MFKKFIGWLFLTDKYLSTLTDQQVRVKALGKKAAREYVLEDTKRNVRAIEELEAQIRKFQDNYPTIIFYKDETR